MQAPRNKRPITNACAPRKRACHCEPPSSRSGIGAIAMVRRRVFRPPFCTAFKIGGRLGVDCQVGVLLFVSVLQKARTSPPRFALPPRFGGLLGEDLGVEVRIGRPHETHRRSRSAPAQNTNVEKATRSPHSGGQRRRRGGRVLALRKTCNKKPTSGGGRVVQTQGPGRTRSVRRTCLASRRTFRSKPPRKTPHLNRSASFRNRAGRIHWFWR